MLYSDIAIPV